MLRIATDVPIDDPHLVAHFVKDYLEGCARGFSRCMHRWGLPPLYSSGIRFQTPPTHGSGFEWFSSPLATYQRGWGDCDQLVIYRIAELLANGENAGCRTIWIGPSLHVQVRRTDGKKRWVEDPSVQLGATVAWPPAHLWDKSA